MEYKQVCVCMYVCTWVSKYTEFKGNSQPLANLWAVVSKLFYSRPTVWQTAGTTSNAIQSTCCDILPTSVD